jgi:hypothetical protein
MTISTVCLGHTYLGVEDTSVYHDEINDGIIASLPLQNTDVDEFQKFECRRLTG